MKYKFQLPVPSENFQGRTRELSKLKDFFNTQHILIIAGMPGIGKTSLAMAYALSINTENNFLAYHNKVIWIHCEEGWKLDSLFFEIDCWLIDRGVKDFTDVYKDQNMDINEKLQHLAGVLENNNFVVFLDDFQNIENEDTILFIRFCKKYLRRAKIVITTRKRLKLSALDRVDIFERRLDGLSLEDAKILIIKLLKQHDYIDISNDSILKIMEKVKGHPFSIKLFVSLLIAEDLTVEELLEDSSEFEEEIEDYLIEKTYNNLSKEEKNILRTFSMFRIPVPLESLKYIMKGTDIRKHRGTLVDKYLLEPRENRTYSMHDLLRSYCQSEINNKDKEELHKKCAEYHDNAKSTIHNKQEAIYHYFEIKEFEKVQEIAFDIIDELEIQGQLQELMEIINKTLQCNNENNSVLLLKKAKIFKLWKENDKALEIYNKLLENEEDEILKANALQEYAGLKIDKGEYEEALQLFFDCYEIYEKNNDIESLSVCLNQIGIIYGYQEQYDNAIESFEKALQYSRSEKNILLEIKIHTNLGITYSSKGKYTKALENLNEALKIEKLKGNTRGYVTTLYSIAGLHLNRNDLNEALKISQEVIELSKDLNDKTLVAYAKNIIGSVYLRRNKKEEAYEYLMNALNICEEIEDIRAQANILTNIARYYYKDNNFILSLNTIIKSNLLYKKMNIKKDLFIGKIFEVLCQIKINDENSAMKLLAELSILAEELDENKYFAYLNKIYEIYYKGDIEKEKHYFDKFNKYYKDLSLELKQEILSFYQEEKEEKDNNNYIIKTRDSKNYVSFKELEEFVKEKNKYDIFIDLVNKEVIEKEKGIIKILKKRTLSPLFLMFIKNPGVEFSFKELFQAIWEREYDFETDGITVRVNISRLRALLEKNKKVSKYIKISSKGGKYYFEKNSNYCLIMEKEKI